MHLFIGNKVYSSWSMRPWLAMRMARIPFEETLIPLFDDQFADRVAELSGAGRVPVLLDGETKVWETLSILEYLTELYPDRGIWPKETASRAHARSVAAEMHAGFSALRSACPMNLAKRFARRDRGIGVEKDVERFESIVGEARERFGEGGDGPFLYGAFCAADAMFAPLVTRLDTYDIAVNDKTRSYMAAVLGCEAFQEWLADALKENWIVAADEADEPATINLRPYLTS